MVADKSKKGAQIKSLIIQYKAVFGSPEGKRVLHDLIANHHVMTGTYDSDAMKMAFREGERSVIMRILQNLAVEPDQFVEMFEEQMSPFE